MLYKSILSLVFVSLILPMDLSAGRMRGKCFEYAYETVLSILSEGINPTTNRSQRSMRRVKLRAFNTAGDSCRREVNDTCLKYAYDRISETHREPTQKTKWRVWGQAVNACRKKVETACLQYAEDFWQNARKPRDPYRAFQNAVVSCDNDVKRDCLAYVFHKERERGRSEMAAFNSGVTVCRDGTRKACLQLITERISPDARPTARNHWGDATLICRRK